MSSLRLATDVAFWRHRIRDQADRKEEESEEMAIWRNHDLEVLFGGSLDESGITFASLARLVEEGVTEGEQIEFKRNLPASSANPKEWSEFQEFAKDVAALANGRGGVLVYGVKENRGRATALVAMLLDPEKEERRRRQVLISYQAPSVVCDFVWVSHPGGGHLLLVVIPPSPRGPHAVLAEGSPARGLQYPVRHGADTLWLSEHEVADRYRRRFIAQERAERRLEHVTDVGLSALRKATGLWLFSALVPESPVDARLDRSTLATIEEWHKGSGLVSPLGRYLPALGRGIAAPGRVTFTGGLGSGEEDETVVRDAYVELHIDGSAFAAVPIAERTDDEGHGREVGERTLTDDSILLVDVITRWCAHQAGAWGTAPISSGFVDAQSTRGIVEEPMVFVERDGGGLHRVRATRELRGEVRTKAVADLAAVDTVQQRLAVVYQVLAGLLQWFGWPEPLVLRADGSLRAIESLVSDHNQVVGWARRNDVSVEKIPGSWA